MRVSETASRSTEPWLLALPVVEAKAPAGYSIINVQGWNGPASLPAQWSPITAEGAHQVFLYAVIDDIFLQSQRSLQLLRVIDSYRPLHLMQRSPASGDNPCSPSLVPVRPVEWSLYGVQGPSLARPDLQLHLLAVMYELSKAKLECKFLLACIQAARWQLEESRSYRAPLPVLERQSRDCEPEQYSKDLCERTAVY